MMELYNHDEAVIAVPMTMRARICNGKIEPRDPIDFPDGQEVTVTVEPYDLEVLRRQQFLEEANRCYARLRADDTAWKEELDERRVWEGTLADDLTED